MLGTRQQRPGRARAEHGLAADAEAAPKPAPWKASQNESVFAAGDRARELERHLDASEPPGLAGP